MKSKQQVPIEIFDYQSVDAGHYDRICTEGNPLRSFWHQYRFRRTELMINSTPESSILDLGCANGTFLGNFSRPFAKAVGIDVSEVQIEFARKRYSKPGLEFLAGDIRDIDFEDASFDFIVMSEVIEHISYEHSVLLVKTIGRLLKPGGRLIITTPNYNSLWPVLEFLVNKFSNVSYEHQHINKLTVKACRRLFAEAGFKVEAVETFYVAAPFLSFLSKDFAARASDLEARILPAFGAEICLAATPL